MELTQTAVTVEAKNAAELPRDVVMVDMSGCGRDGPEADGAQESLFAQHPTDVALSDPVATHEMIMARAAVQPLP